MKLKKKYTKVKKKNSKQYPVACLEFDLSDEYQKMEFQAALDGHELKIILSDFFNYFCRKITKHDTLPEVIFPNEKFDSREATDQEQDLIRRVVCHLYNELEAYNINLD